MLLYLFAFTQDLFRKILFLRNLHKKFLNSSLSLYDEVMP